MFATTAVLTGIAGWDPIYAAFRSIALKIRSMKSGRSLSHASAIH